MPFPPFAPDISLWAICIFVGVVLGVYLGFHRILVNILIELMQDADPRKKKDAYYELFDDAEDE